MSWLNLGPQTLTEERTFQETFELYKPKVEPKPKKSTKPSIRKPQVRKPRVPTKTVEEKIASRQAYDRTRAKTPERKELQRRRTQARRSEAKALGLCKDCRQPAIQDQRRCEACRDKHNRARKRKSQNNYIGDLQ